MVIVPAFALSAAPAPFVNVITIPPDVLPIRVGLTGWIVTPVAGAPIVTPVDAASSGADEVWTRAVYVPPVAGVRMPAAELISIRTRLPAGSAVGVATLIAVPDLTTAAAA